MSAALGNYVSDNPSDLGNFMSADMAGQSFADPEEIDHATRVATAQLNARAAGGAG